MIRRGCILSAAGVCLLVLVFAWACPAWASLEAQAVHSCMKVRPLEPVEGTDAPHLYCAKNEWEAVQVVVADSDGGSLTGCDVTVSALEGSGEDIVSIDLYRETYIYIHHPSRKPVLPETMGYWPDGMVPFVDSYYGEDRDGAPFDVMPEWNQAIWIEVYVPEGQEAGDYTGVIEVTCQAQEPVSIPLTLTVWDFELPNEISLPSAYGFSCGVVYSKHGGSTEKLELNRMYFIESLKHRLMLGWGHCLGPVWTWDPDTGTGTLDFTDFDAFMGPALDGTLYNSGASFDTFGIPGLGGWETQQRIAYWRAYAEHFKEKGWFDKLFLYLPDEPTPDEYPYLVELANLLHEADPDLRAMATEQIADGLIGAVDIWCPDEPLFSDSLATPPFPEHYPPRQALGEEVWWYNCTSAQALFDFSTHFVDDQGMYLRIWPWLTRRYNFDGLLYWSTIYLYYAVGDLWEDAYAKRFLCNGDGTMFYPGRPDKIGGTLDIPIPSLRLKIFREGMEDYEYFRILDDMGYEDFVQAEVERRANKSFQWEHDPAEMEVSRHRLVQKILGTLDESAPPIPADLAAEPMPSGARISWSPVAAEDLSGYRIYLGRYPGERQLAERPGPEADFVELSDLQPGKSHYVCASSIDESGNESECSREVEFVPLGDEGEGDSDDDADAGGDDDDDDEVCGL